MRVTCTNCGGAHTPWDCKRPAKKSTAALTEVHSAPRDAIGRAAMSQTGPAGLKDLPVDTNTADAEKSANLTRGVTAGETATIQKRPRGRPKSITDMAAYKRAKQREYRRKWAERK